MVSIDYNVVVWLWDVGCGLADGGALVILAYLYFLTLACGAYNVRNPSSCRE